MAGETLITFVGNVVDDTAELRFTPAGAAVAKFRMASTPRKFDKTTNSWVDQEPTFLTVNVWRDQAEHVAESLQKGMRVVVVGQLRSRSYETTDGQKRTVFEIEADEVAPSLKFATAKVTRAQRSGGGQGGGQQSRPSGQGDAWSQQAPPQQGSGGWGGPTQSGAPDAPF